MIFQTTTIEKKCYNFSIWSSCFAIRAGSTEVQTVLRTRPLVYKGPTASLNANNSSRHIKLSTPAISFFDTLQKLCNIF